MPPAIYTNNIRNQYQYKKTKLCCKMFTNNTSTLPDKNCL